MKKIFVWFLIFLVSTFIYANKDEGIEKFHLEENNIEIVILYPSNVYKSDTVKIIAIMINKTSKSAYMGGLTLSFPQLDNTEVIYHKNNFDKISKYSPPQKIYNKKLDNHVSCKYPMIEGWENNWDSKEDRGFFVEFTIPKNLKNLIINVRGVLIFKDGKKKKIVSVPEDSPYLDKQQDYLVAKLNIPIKSIKEIPGQIQKDDEIVSGTGFFINKGYLISNNHVIENCSSIDIIRKGYKSSAKVIDRDEINDLAILKAKQENSSYLKFRDKKKVKIGEKIITMGYPLGSLLGNNIKLTIGNISSLTGLMNDSTKLQLTAPIQHGNSGGPLLDKNGEVIGVVYAQLNNNIAQNVNLAIKANLVKMFLDTNGIQYQEYDTFENMNTEDVADMAKNGIVQVICR